MISINKDTKVLILPCAVIASGKTSLAKLLKNNFNIGHIQSDDIKAKRPAPIFVEKVMECFSTEGKNIVFADRNNHLLQHRLALSTAFKKKYPDGKILGLNWEYDQYSRDQMKKICCERVLMRGNEHQTLTPEKTPDFERIIQMFLKQRVPLNNILNSEDSYVDVVLNLNIDNQIQQNFDLVCKALGWKYP
ncbi:hypothetical protein HK099_004869 [Clydaea vesicula]|uniref:tRNA ligase kinase domain-containing protein n=1 Tax=Clydaea vesicula TaxID=447962 RepID=A0AAD5U015_9FUNG|nr:hypothetical protein HK099_004869 [Clydaea vesicula]